MPGKTDLAERIIRSEWHRLTLLSGIIFLITGLWVRGILRRSIAVSLLCGLLFLDLAYVNRGAVRHDDRIYTEAARVKKEFGAALGKDRTVFRVGSFKSGWGANFEMYLGYQNVGGYNPLLLQRYYEYLNQYQFYGRSIPEGWSVFFYEEHEHRILMDLLNVKYEVFHKSKSFRLRETYLPRAFLVPRFEFIDKEEILDALIKPGFDPAQVVLFEKGTRLVGSLSPRREVASADLGEANVISYRPDSFTLSVRAASPALLLISEVYYPGWKAYVNGEPRPVLRGNYLFRVIDVPEGTSVVQFAFEPLSIKVGIGVTLLSLLVLLTWSAGRFLVRRR